MAYLRIGHWENIGGGGHRDNRCVAGVFFFGDAYLAIAGHSKTRQGIIILVSVARGLTCTPVFP